MSDTNYLWDRVINVILRTYAITTQATVTDAGTVETSEVESINEYRQCIIKTPEVGPKPVIQFQIKDVPERAGVTATLTLTNVNFDINPDDFREVEVELGYQNAGGLGVSVTQTYICQVLWAYQENPNPNGRIVFWCAVGMNIQEFSEPRPYKLIFNEETTTIKAFCEAIAKALEFDLNLNLPDEITNLELQVKNKTVTTGSKLAMIEWWRTYLENLATGENAIIKSWPSQSQPFKLTFVWDQGTVTIGLRGYHNPELEKLVVDLNYVSSASVAGDGVVNIYAPYNPKLRPGMIAQMPTKFFKGSGSPSKGRTFTSNLGGSGLYQVTLIDVNFSTVGTNEMKVLTCPVHLCKSSIDSALVIHEEAKCKHQEAKAKDETETSSVKKVEIATSARKALTSTSWSSDGETYVVKAGDTMKSLAKKWWPNIHYRKENVKLLPKVTMPFNGYTGKYFWPTIFFATLTKMRGDKSFYVNTNNPTALTVGTNIVKPSWTDPDSISSGVDVFKEMAEILNTIYVYSMYGQDYEGDYKWPEAQDCLQIAAFMEAE